MKPLDFVPKDHTSLKIGDVPRYLKERHQLEISRQTVYNWMNVGKNQETLKYAKVVNPAGERFAFTLFTTVEWVQSFLHRSGLLGA